MSRADQKNEPPGPSAISRKAADFESSVLVVPALAQLKVVEDEMGRRLAPEVLSPASSDLAEYASSFRVVPGQAPAKMLGKSLLELDLRRKFEITILGYFREADAKQGKRRSPTCRLLTIACRRRTRCSSGFTRLWRSSSRWTEPERAADHQRSICMPISTTRSGGMPKYRVAFCEFRVRNANSCSSRFDISPWLVARSVSRPR
jgi:hypothetical protein